MENDHLSDNSDLRLKDIDSNNENKAVQRDGGSKKTIQDNPEMMDDDEINQLLEDPMNKVPPNFDLARKHQDANRVKNIMELSDENAIYNEEEDFCPCCQMPTSKVAPPFKLCTSIFNLEDLGCGFPLYYEFK
jgi:hypothetical protein